MASRKANPKTKLNKRMAKDKQTKVNLEGMTEIVRGVGKPTIMTEKVLNLLETAFAVGATDREACFFAGISHQTLYNYQEAHPEYVDRKEDLKERPILTARMTLVAAVKTDPEMALKYLERKNKKEFSSRSELTGKDGENLMPTPIYGGSSLAATSTDDSEA